MDRRSFLVSALLAPFAWLSRRFGSKPKGNEFYRLEHPMLFERGQQHGIVSRDPEWKFPEGSAYWKVDTATVEPWAMSREDVEDFLQYDVRLSGPSYLYLFDSVDQPKPSRWGRIRQFFRLG